MAPPSAGGYDFLADPNRRADDSPVLWRPGELAAVLILTAAPAGTAMPSISLTDLPGDIIRRDAEDGAHVMIRDDAISHPLWLIDPPNGATPMVALIPLDATAPQRADATLRCWRYTAHGRPRTPPSPIHRVDRLAAAVRALDGRRAGASYRAMAEALFNPSRLASEPWKTTPLRLVAKVTRRCDWRIADLIEDGRPATLYFVVPPSDISRTKPLVRLILTRSAAA